MAKCSVVGCSNTVVGGFREVIGVPHMSDPYAIVSGMRTCWCDEHEESLISSVAGKRGAWLTPDDLKD